MTPRKYDRPILIVEDSPEDFEAAVRAFRKAGLYTPVHRCGSGDDALDYLHGRGRFAGPDAAPRPGFILLDLNLPGTDGREVLAEIKQDDELRAIPVIVLATSVNDRDVSYCYRHGASSYLVKSIEMEELLRAVRLLKEFWTETVRLPRAA